MEQKALEIRRLRLRAPMLFLLGMFLAFLDFIAFGQILYSGVERVLLGLVLVVAEAYLRTFIVLCAFVLEVYLANLSRRGWFEYALVTMAICGGSTYAS